MAKIKHKIILKVRGGSQQKIKDFSSPKTKFFKEFLTSYKQSKVNAATDFHHCDGKKHGQGGLKFLRFL
jgi:hypothetical protein